MNNVFLIIVDTFSKWIDVVMMFKTHALSTIRALRKVFSIFGLPKSLVSDNGSPFGSVEFLKFCELNNIEVLKSPPYHPQSNGDAERAVRTT